LPATHQRTVRVADLNELCRGDTIEARTYDTLHYRGEIEVVVPHLGILWIRHGTWRERKLLDPTEYELWKLSTPAAPRPETTVDGHPRRAA
jgi:hypothetical protein